MTREQLAILCFTLFAFGVVLAFIVRDTAWYWRLRGAWYRWRHPRCTRDLTCLLDDGHAGECDLQPYD